jgi:hypothetical protein
MVSKFVITKKERSSESSGMYCHVLNWMSTVVSEVRAASIIRAMIMEAVRTSEISKKERAHNKFVFSSP